ncbi:TPA: hypothetical protein ACN37W_004532 [Vibrio parahaemolyticus]
MTISFEDYCEDYLDLHIALMGDEQLKSARAGYADLVRNSKTPAEIAKHKKALAKAKESRKLAKFYGGKALTGSAAQKKWAEDIRQGFLESSVLTDEQKQSLVTCGGFTNSSKFWIENRNVSASVMTAENIVKQYTGLQQLEEKHYRTLATSGPVAPKNAARKEIADYLKACPFAFESQWA